MAVGQTQPAAATENGHEEQPAAADGNHVGANKGKSKADKKKEKRAKYKANKQQRRCVGVAGQQQHPQPRERALSCLPAHLAHHSPLLTPRPVCRQQFQEKPEQPEAAPQVRLMQELAWQQRCLSVVAVGPPW